MTEATDQRVHKGDVENTSVTFENKLDGSFFRVRLDRTTELEGAYLRATEFVSGQLTEQLHDPVHDRGGRPEIGHDHE